MKKSILLVALAIVFLFFIILIYGNFQNITGKTADSFGPSQEEQSCMLQCMKCTSPGVGCTGNQEECMSQCNLVKPEQTAEESCVEQCTLRGCSKYDFSCQSKYQSECDKECGMVKEPEAKSEEEQCIKDCVNKAEPGLICQSGEGGEKGNEICQRCAKDCEYLYAGPCLMELELENKKAACVTCEHCYGKPVMGDSGEGYECIVDIECNDATSEFGDNPGTGEGIVARAGEAMGNVFEAIGDFFSGIFRGEENKNLENPEPASENSESISSQSQ